MNDLACSMLEKKQKEKGVKEENDKENAVGMLDGEPSDPQSHIGISNLVASQPSGKFSSTATDIYDEINGLERRLDHAMDAKIEKLDAPTDRS